MAACSATTANLSDIKMGNDKAITTPSTTFAPADTIYASSDVQNNGDKVTVQWHLYAVSVDGTPPNTELKQASTSTDIDGDETSAYHVNLNGGWPMGTYKLEADMLYNGEQKSQKTAQFTVQ